MKAWVSLHNDAPEDQLDQEVNYQGYHRMPIEFDENMGEKAQQVFFPAITNDTKHVIKYVAIGACESGQGEIFMRIHSMPYIECKVHVERLTEKFWMDNGASQEQAAALIKTHGYIVPDINIVNSNPIKLPDDMNPIARRARQLVDSGLMRADELHPKLFESINDELANAGVPVLTVNRGGAFKMEEPISKMKSFNHMMGNA